MRKNNASNSVDLGNVVKGHIAEILEDNWQSYKSFKKKPLKTKVKVAAVATAGYCAVTGALFGLSAITSHSSSASSDSESSYSSYSSEQIREEKSESNDVASSSGSNKTIDSKVESSEQASVQTDGGSEPSNSAPQTDYHDGFDPPEYRYEQYLESQLSNNYEQPVEQQPTYEEPAQPLAQTQPQQEPVSDNAASEPRSPNSGVDYNAYGYCMDGTYVYGDPSARGRANKCYGHGGWRDY